MTITIRSSCISVLLVTQADIPGGQMWDSVVVTVVTMSGSPAGLGWSSGELGIVPGKRDVL